MNVLSVLVQVGESGWVYGKGGVNANGHVSGHTYIGGVGM